MHIASITTTRRAGRVHIHRVVAGGMTLLGLLVLAGCGNDATSAGPSGDPSAPPIAAPAAPAAPTAAQQPTATTLTESGGALAGRSGVLTNPDNMQVVFLYYDLAGIPPPLDQWVEEDPRVASAPGAEKAARRAQVKAELQAGLAAVRNVGELHLTTYANLSQYDPTYGEFTVGALAPSSAYTFQALNQQVNVKLDNGLDAQTWRVPKDQAQATTDKLSGANPTVDVVLKITKVLPATSGGSVVTHVQSWTLRDARSGTTLARVNVPAR